MTFVERDTWRADVYDVGDEGATLDSLPVAVFLGPENWCRVAGDLATRLSIEGCPSPQISHYVLLRLGSNTTMSDDGDDDVCPKSGVRKSEPEVRI
jgi:hypothetical protein